MIYDIIEESNSLCRLYGQKNSIINLYGIRRIYVMWMPAQGRRWKEENMLRVKKVSDAIFPRDFSKTMQSYINIFRDNFSRIKNVQISNIIKHYESKLLSIKNRIEEVEYSKKAKHEPGTDLVF